MTALTLTNDQEAAFNSFTQFLADDSETVFVLSGYAGTGKSTMIRHVLDNIESVLKALRLVKPKLPHYTIQLTATTNKAAENLAQITKDNVPTIHSFLGLRVHTDYSTGVSKLIPAHNREQTNQILFIDEASYVDSQLLTWIFKRVKNSKIVFIGDPAQLIPVKAKNAPVFEASFNGAQLTEVVRQAAGNPVLDLATKFRETVTSGEFFSFTPDGHHVQHLPREDFEQVLVAEFTKPSWSSQESKILAWTNKTVEKYNKGISAICTGSQKFKVGDYVQCNKYFNAGQSSIKTDQVVLITDISLVTQRQGVLGHMYTLDNKVRAFCPDNLSDKKALHKAAMSAKNEEILRELEADWIDLRSVYACTINKSQGSTYDRVFIDLDDLRKCNSGNSIARLLYVGVSRARHQVFFTGDLV